MESDLNHRIMNLTKLRKDDTFVEHDEWSSRDYLHNELKNSDLHNISCNDSFFETSEYTGKILSIPCHLIIPVVVLQATIKKEDGEDWEGDFEEEDDYDVGIDPESDSESVTPKVI